jgi:ABC-type uncharacterized transport system auxiliary subunit
MLKTRRKWIFFREKWLLLSFRDKLFTNINYYLINLKSIVIILFSIFLLSSCFSIRTEYPRVEYYRLEQEQVSVKNIGKMPVTLMVKDFIPASELETSHLMALWDENRLQRYNYHLWNTDLASMLTDFIIKRYNTTGAFTGGVVKSSASISPDFIMECHLIDMMAYNFEKSGENKNYVFVSIQVNVFRRTPLDAKNNIILSQVYSQKVTRADNLVKTIVPAFSTAVSLMTDKMLIDVQAAIAKELSGK